MEQRDLKLAEGVTTSQSRRTAFLRRFTLCYAIILFEAFYRCLETSETRTARDRVYDLRSAVSRLAASYEFFVADQLPAGVRQVLDGLGNVGVTSIISETGTIATDQPAPDVPRSPILGYANTALEWGDERWSAFVWQLIPAADAGARGRLMMHELFHRHSGLRPRGAPGRLAFDDELGMAFRCHRSGE